MTQSGSVRIEPRVHLLRKRNLKTNKMKTIIKDAVPGTYNLKTLAGFYGVCTKTMAKNIKVISHLLRDRSGRRLYFINEVETIFLHYGTPKIQIKIEEVDQKRTA